MFVYQAAIMLVVVLIVCLLAFVLKINTKLLALAIAALVVTGGLTLSIIQDFFQNHYYSQKIDTSLYKNLTLDKTRRKKLPEILKGYRSLGTSGGRYDASYEKTYRVTGKGASSSIDVEVLLFKTTATADEYFKLRQTFYENKYFLQNDTTRSLKSDKSDSFRYLTSYVKSYYPNPRDLIYLPSKIYYLSDVVIQNKSFVITVTEKSNREIPLKAGVLRDLKKRFSEYG